MLRFWRGGVEEGWKKRIPDVFASATSSRRCPSKSTPTFLPLYRLGNSLHPIRDLVDKIMCGGRGCGEKKSNWREGEREKRHRGRGKGQGHGGVYRTGRNKESVYTNALADKTKETKWNKPAAPSPPPTLLRKDYCGFLNTDDFFQRKLFVLWYSQGNTEQILAVRNLETLLTRCDRMRVCPLLVFLCLLCAGRAQKFSALTVGRATDLPERVPFTCICYISFLSEESGCA